MSEKAVRIGAYAQGSMIKQKERRLLKLVQLFELGQIGLEAVDGKDGVKVESVAKGERFDKAGLRKDDRITAVNTEKVRSAEELRRSLRVLVQEHGRATLEIRRGEDNVRIDAQF